MLGKDAIDQLAKGTLKEGEELAGSPSLLLCLSCVAVNVKIQQVAALLTKFLLFVRGAALNLC